MANNKLPVPKLTDIVADPKQAFKNDELKLLLNSPPPDAWVQKNKFANNALYLSIDKVELLLDKIFQEWKVEVLETKVIFNAISVNVRVHYLNPVTGLWSFHDGVGAKELQTKSGTGVLKPDFSNVNGSAVEMALPIAKTNAIKDACDHLGKLFGRDLNRKMAIDFIPTHLSIADQNKVDSEKNLIDAINECLDMESLTIITDSIDVESYSSKVQHLIKAKQSQFSGTV